MHRDPMPDVIVLLPGVMGSVLRKDGKDVWAASGGAVLRGLFSRGDTLRDLTLTGDNPAVDDLGDGITAHRLMPDVHLIPGLWKIDAYTAIGETLVKAFDLTEGQNYFEFPYDWRRDNRVAARRLQRDSAAWLRNWRDRSGNANARLILVAHSMGGIVSRYFLECLDGWRDTRALITFGTPFRGSLNALDTLVNGAKKGPFGVVDLSALTRSFTSVYQLLPIYECYDPGDGNLLRVGQTQGIPNVDAEKATAALAFHHEMLDRQRANQQAGYPGGGYLTFPVVGTHQSTKQSARRTGNKVEFRALLAGEDLGGDGTVPRVSATPPELSDAARDMFAATPHASLQNAGAVSDHLQGAIRSLYLNLGQFLAPVPPGVKLSLAVDDIYWPDEPVDVRVRPDREDVRLEARIVETATGREVARSPLTLGGDGWYQAGFRPLPGGTYRVVVAAPAGSPVSPDEPAVEPAIDVFAVLDEGPDPSGETSRLAGSTDPTYGVNVGDSTAVPPPLGERLGGPMRGGVPEVSFAPDAPEAVAENGGERPEPAVGLVDVILSAQGAGQVALAQEQVIDVRVELAAGATPLAHAIPTAISPTDQIVAILTIEGSALEVVGPRLLRLAPPGPNAPTTSAFVVRGAAPGTTRVAVLFRQGGTELGSVAFSMTVVPAATDAAPVGGQVVAERREVSDRDVLTLLIEERRSGDEIRYRYVATCEALGLDAMEFESDRILARGGTTGSASLSYVESIYRRIVERALQTQDDIQTHQRELRGIGTELCRELFDPDFVRSLWEKRNDISAVKVTSWEPYIPWELVRLKHPESQETDERFLAEYGLVRSLSGRGAPRRLRASEWRYVVAQYPEQSHPPITSAANYLTVTLPQQGITPREIAPRPNDVLNALAAPDFDVLHIACHGTTDLSDIGRTALILGDRPGDSRGPLPVTLDPSTVREEAVLGERLPLIFLNACETGRQAPTLTDLGGWPRAFWEAGAGAFVGTSWSVREVPATAFAAGFYDALRGGAGLAAAAVAGRTAAKKLGDGSWLAYVVYGHPGAKVTAPDPGP